MSKKYSRILGVILAVALCLGALTVFANAASTTFTDVPKGSWYYDAVMTCAEKGYVNGVGNNLFLPAGQLTNAQVYTMLTNAFYKAEKQDYENNRYLEMDEYFGGNPKWWSYNAYYFMDNGLLEGVDINIKSTASVSEPTSRYDMVQVVTNILNSKGIEVSSADKAAAQTKISDWSDVPVKYHNAVSTCVALGIVNGYSDHSFGGDDSLTRAQACVILNTLVDVVAKGGSSSVVTPPVEDEPAVNYCDCTCDACKDCTGTPGKPENPPAVTPSTKDIEITTKVTQYGTGYYVGDNGFGTGCLNNGKPITEDNVLELLAEAEKIWPTGLSWTYSGTLNNHWYQSSGPVVDSILLNKYRVSANYACGGFAAMISDYLFGKSSNPGRLVTDQSEIRPGDIILEMGADGNVAHVVIAASKSFDDAPWTDLVYYADGNGNSKVSWPSQWQMPINDAVYKAINGDGCYLLVYTRYPA